MNIKSESTTMQVLGRVFTLLILLTASVCSAQESHPAATRPRVPFEFPTGSKETVIPLERGRSQFYVKARLAGQQIGYLLVDTGSEVTAVTKDVAVRLHLPVIGRKTVSAIAQTEQLATLEANDLQIGPLHFAHRVVCESTEIGEQLANGEFRCGVVGLDVLGQCPLTIDFRHHTLTVHDPAGFVPPSNAQRFAMKERGGTPTLELSVGGRSGWFELDTGFGGGLLLSYEFARLNRDILAGHPALRETGQWGDDHSGYETLWFPVTYLGTERKQQTLTYQAKPGGLTSVAGLLGASWMRDATVTIDLGTGSLWVVWPKEEPADEMVARLRAGPQRDLAGLTPLHYAAYRSRADVVSKLLDDPLDPDAVDLNNMPALTLAAARGDEDSTRLLLDHHAATNIRTVSGGYTPLLLSAEYGCTKTAAMLMDAGADVNELTDDKRSPVFVATDAMQFDMVKLLWSRRAKMDAKTSSGATPLMAACRNGDEPCARLLIENAADVDARGSGRTPLIYAIEARSLPCVRLLVEHGAKVNDVAPYGYTPLAAAAARDEEGTIVEYLLAHGADIHMRCRDDKTAADLAMERGSLMVINLLNDQLKKGRREPTTTP